MRDTLDLIAAVDQVPGVATVTVRSEFGPSSHSRLRDDVLWVAATCPGNWCWIWVYLTGSPSAV